MVYTCISYLHLRKLSIYEIVVYTEKQIDRNRSYRDIFSVRRISWEKILRSFLRQIFVHEALCARVTTFCRIRRARVTITCTEASGKRVSTFLYPPLLSENFIFTSNENSRVTRRRRLRFSFETLFILEEPVTSASIFGASLIFRRICNLKPANVNDIDL